jgi:hypothetical protein
MSFISLNDILWQVREDIENTDAVNYIYKIIPVAEAQVFDLINRNSSGFTGNTLPANVKHAMIYLAADLYEFRESKSRFQVYKVPDTVDALISNYINYGTRY